MHPDDHVCLCFRVSLRKIRTYLRTEDPAVASLISECLGAGTGCQWCVPFLRHLHAEHTAGRVPDLGVSPQRYAEARLGFHKTGERDQGVVGGIREDSTTESHPEPGQEQPGGDRRS